MLGSLVSSGLGSILGGANSLAKTVFGDKAAKEAAIHQEQMELQKGCLLYTSPSPRDS